MAKNLFIALMDVGIVGYGAYVPRYRVKAEEIAHVWGANAEIMKRGLKIQEKSVPDADEDTVTIAVESARNALQMAEINPADIGAIYIGSESHPYAVKPTAGIVGEAIEAIPVMMAADLEFACKAGTAGLQAAVGLVKSGMIKYGLAGGCDTSQGSPGDALEYTASAGGGCYIVGKENTVADLIATSSFTTDTPDFWRREGADYPRHAGRFSGEPAYFRHVVEGTKKILTDNNMKPEDFDYAVFHQPNGKFPRAAAKILGFTDEQIAPAILVDRIGNTYSGATMLGLAAVLDVAKPGQKILVTSYGSGSGSDSFIYQTTDRLPKAREGCKTVESYIANKKNIDYGTYVKLRRKLKLND